MMNVSLDGSGGGEEDADDSSSSSPESLNNLPNQFKSALDEFREKWQKEIKSSDKQKINTSENYQDNNDDDGLKLKATPKCYGKENIPIEDDEKRAKDYYMQGIENEKHGKVYEALRFYRRAIQIVPDIEFRIYEMAKSQQQQQRLETNNNIFCKDEASNVVKINDDDEEEEEDLSNVNLHARFHYDIAKRGKLMDRANFTNSETDISNLQTISGAHISDLPMEIILYILRWVVSAQLDLRSLEQCAGVCKGFYLCARDEEIWKSACLKVWGVNTGLLKNSPFGSWRQMFIERHRVNFNGCYISKTSYLRYGENSFQDQFYRPVQLIEYYRYIRFLPDSTVVMMTSAEEPSQCVGKLNNTNQHRNDVLKGHYRLRGDLIIIVLKRYLHKSSQNTVTNYTKKRSTSGAGDTDGAIHTFYIELKIQSSSKRRFCQLQWQHYSIIQIKNKKEISTDFELTTAKYPPLWFSRVKSYNMESEIPLK